MQETAEAPVATRRDGPATPSFGPVHVLLGALTGFLIGVIVTVAFAPALGIGHTNASTHGTPTPIPQATTAPVTETELAARIRSYANQALVYSSVSGLSRLQSVNVRPAGFPTRVATQPVLFNAIITFSLNPNPFRNYQVRSARADVFLVLQKLYSHNLPLNVVALHGTFHLPGQKSATIMLRAVSNPIIQTQFNWSKLARGSEKKVWRALPVHFIDSRFAHVKPKA
ncbi:MAG TPA: hypothetical protein VFB34_01425 [Chloroflexota bacterium]|nr:hypothetical protein [Chloroflexota bacterium]